MAYRTVLVCDICKKDIDINETWYKVHNYNWIKVKQFKEGDIPTMEKEGHLCGKCGEMLERMLYYLEITYKTVHVMRNKEEIKSTLIRKEKYRAIYI